MKNSRLWQALPSSQNVAVALLASGAILTGSISAHAGTKEVSALAKAAGVSSKQLNTVSTTNLIAAIKTVVSSSAFSSAKEQAIVVGEALKAAGAADAGEAIANDIHSGSLKTIITVTDAFVESAAKTAGTGGTANVLQIPAFAATLYPSTGNGAADNTHFVTLATNAGSPLGAAALLGARASEFTGDATSASVTLAGDALVVKKLATDSLNIARFISAEIADTSSTSDFATGMANSAPKSTVAIAEGVATGDPTNAGNIAAAIFGEQILTSAGTYVSPSPAFAVIGSVVTVADKAALTLAKGLAKVADIEEIQKIGHAVGLQMQSGGVKLTVAVPLEKALVSAIIAKPLVGDIAALNNNKADEIAETVAYLTSGLVSGTDLTKYIGTAAKNKAGAAYLISIAKAAMSVIPSKKTQLQQSTYAADVVGSLYWTLEQADVAGTLPDEIYRAFVTAITTASTQKSISSKNAATIATIVTQIHSGLSNDQTLTLKLENGYDPAGAVSDPETDTHPFSA